MSQRRILLAVGTDGEAGAARLETTIELAFEVGAVVTLGHVFTADEYEVVCGRLGFDEPSPEVDPTDVARRHAQTRTIAGQLDEAGIDYEIRGAVGNRGTEIVAMAEAIGADRIVVGGRQRTPTGKAIFGSTSQEVLLTAPCPVTFVRDDG